MGNAGLSMKWIGCALTIVGIIVVVYILTHITEIWNFLDRLLPRS